ncbi:hypothetical protein [Rhodoferax ferrireducens]|uniref:hypothetical protein n=1 Tax=Rhodoferax ferrireducens TaxID=192843 RepID=UPI0002DF031C|nr:hypothetical protein [Rhodoferax ferrireducens]
MLQFLELRSLIITDLDSVEKPGGTACAVHLGAYSSNACLKTWFSKDDPFTLAGLLAKGNADKVDKRNRIAYQCPEQNGDPCGRTFEDAFILANPTLFGLTAKTPQELELEARSKADALKKSEFALKHAIAEKEWTAPTYILDGVRWLAGGDGSVPDSALAIAVEAVAAHVEGATDA